MSRSLSGRVVAVTGAARGIGAATAAELTRRGARVALGDLDADLAEETARRLGGGAVAIGLDVTDHKSLTSFLDETEARLGPLDVLVNNAGIMPLATLLDEDDAVTRRVFDVNVLAMIVGSREAARRMVPRGRGHIVIVASTAGTMGLPGGATYCASKAAMIAFCEGIEPELAPYGVHVSCVMPGIVRTELAVGVPDIAGLKGITPEDVALGIAAALERPRLDVYVPRSAGPMVRLPRLLPRRAGQWLGRRLKADRVFLDAHQDPQRSAYEARATRDR